MIHNKKMKKKMKKKQKKQKLSGNGSRGGGLPGGLHGSKKKIMKVPMIKVSTKKKMKQSSTSTKMESNKQSVFFHRGFQNSTCSRGGKHITRREFPRIRTESSL